MLPAPRMGGHERSGQVEYWCLSFVCGDGRKVFKKGANASGRSTCALLTHEPYVVWYQGPSVDTCRDTYVASVEKKENSQ